MPPVMVTGAYLMLEVVDRPAIDLGIIRAALIPAILYYLSLPLIIRSRTGPGETAAIPRGRVAPRGHRSSRPPSAS